MTQQFIFGGGAGVGGARSDLLSVSLTLRGNPATTINATGELRTVALAIGTDYPIAFGVGNNHVAVQINGINGVGDLTINGASVNPSTGLVTVGDSEVITVDGTSPQIYITNNNWWECTSITVGAGISAISYDVMVIGYITPSFNDTAVLGYRMDMVAEGVNPDIRFRLIKVVAGADKKATLTDLENIAVDSGSAGLQILDGVRTGPDDRSFDPGVTDLWQDTENLTFITTDFNTYWSGNENYFFVGDNSGIIARFEGAPTGGITNIDFVNLLIVLADL